MEVWQDGWALVVRLRSSTCHLSLPASGIKELLFADSPSFWLRILLG